MRCICIQQLPFLLSHTLTLALESAVGRPEKRSGRMNSEKTSWSEVVGWPASAAVTQINSDRPDVAIEVVPAGTNVAPGYNASRVRV
ncbi:hypothetical protein C2845_PM11G13080 [Panicum miliaceum]|uniref:Uncharacterized protein n=1 Tax=Panicum miliaceum TaxID=4540 RepID=A0A3L6RTP2_PANMI|nr:hypothetical protein C2845_PM11G13080 [Panicum miliaceum]